MIHKTSIINESFLLRIKRKLFAKPVLNIDINGGCTLIWHWKGGREEEVMSVLPKPNELVEVPGGTRVMYTNIPKPERYH